MSTVVMDATKCRFLPSLGVIALLLTGCGVLTPQSDRTQFYVLRPLSAPAAAEGSAPPRGLTVGLGPIDLAAYLDRPELVRRLGPNRVEIMDADRWASPLRLTLPSVLGTDLSNLLGPQAVTAFPWSETAVLDYEVQVDVQRFEPESDGTGTLVARWTVKDGKSKRVLLVRDSDIRKPAAAATTDAAVAALNDAINELSRDIAGGLQELRPRRASEGGKSAVRRGK